MRHPSPSSPAFSLTELLVIMCLISILAAFSIPAMSGIKTSGDTRMAAVELSSLINQARLLAVSQNTYTYVFFKEGTPTPSIEAVLFSSSSGINCFEDSPSLDTGDGTSGRLIRQVSLPQVGLLPNPELPLSSSPPYARPSAVSHLGESYQLTDRGAVFDKCIVFRPTGEMGIPQTSGTLAFSGVTEFALSWNTSAGQKPAISPRPILIFQIAAATGQTTVHQAQ